MYCLVSVVLVSLVSVVTDDCGVCFCSVSRDKIVCAGKGFVTPPVLPKEALDNAIGLGLQRNYITVISAEYVNAFTRLHVIDLRKQRTRQGCVIVEGDIRVEIEVIGKVCQLTTTLLPPSSPAQDGQQPSATTTHQVIVVTTATPDAPPMTTTTTTHVITITTATDELMTPTTGESFTQPGSRPGSWEEDDTGPAYRANSRDSLLVAVAACAGMLLVLLVPILALLISFYKSRLQAWLRARRQAKERQSPPPVATLSASVNSTGNELFSSSSDETLFVSPPSSVLVHRLQDGSIPPAAAAAALGSAPPPPARPPVRRSTRPKKAPARYSPDKF